ncbi:MAG: ankyrin repeat domain-containing protein [Akkermansia sp.]|nr:ankyrin repeat domain-containing protein [Akkermansia sp.]
MNTTSNEVKKNYTTAQLFKAIYANDVAKVKEIVHEGRVNLEATISILPGASSPPDSYFKQYGYGCRCYGVTPLHEAARRGHADIVEVLIHAGSNIHATTSNPDKTVHRHCHHLTPLHFAARSGDVRCVELLLNAGARADAMAYDNQTPLHFASKNSLIVNRLLKAGGSLKARSERFQYTPGHIASEINEQEIAKALLEAGAKVNEKDGDGKTMLSLAAKAGHSQMVQMLIRHGARVDVLDNIGSSPLFEAAFHGNAEVMEILIDNGANVNLKGCQSSPLHTAVENGHLECARLLIANGANVNAKDYWNLLPLVYAIRRQNESMVKLLVENGSRVVDTSSNFSPHTEVLSCHNKEIKDIIQNASKLRRQNSLNRQLRPSTDRQNRQTGKWLNLLVIIAIIIWILKHFFPAYFDFSNFF